MILDHADWSLVPEHCQPGLRRYFLQGLPTGSFLRAILENDPITAQIRADCFNKDRFDDFEDFLKRFAPAGSWGSPEAYAAWIRQGGLSGRAAL